MPTSHEVSGASAAAACQRLRDEAAEMFTEMQRADTKATTLCGVTGGLLALTAAALSSASTTHGWLPKVTLACTAVLLGVALIVALVAIRPVLPQGGRLRVFAGPVADGAWAQDAASAVHLMATAEQLRTERERLALFACLAQRKFRVVRWAGDVTATAISVAGIGLLSAYIPL